MNKNIFDPRGQIDRITFILYYILLVILYIGIGIFLFSAVAKYGFNINLILIPFILIRILLLFNYKKRIMNFCPNLPIAIISAIILTFDFDFLQFLQNLKDQNLALTLYISCLIFVVCIQPLIIGLIPPKKIKEIETEIKSEETQEEENN